MKAVTMNLHVSEYASKGVGVIKEKFGLRSKAEALEKFAEMFGAEFVEKEATDDYIKKLIEIEKKHFEKYSHRKMSLRELDRLCEVA